MVARDGGTRLLDALTLFGSAGTLLCCAVPTLLVFLGFGATVASVTASVPALVTLSQHKGVVFTLAGALMAVAWTYRTLLAPRLRARALGCALDDPRCHAADRLGQRLILASAILYGTGVAVAYGLPWLLARTTS